MTHFAITFGYEGDAVPYQAEGWSPAEKGFTWTVGNRASLLIPKPAVGDYHIRMVVGTFAPEERPWQRVEISLGDTMLSSEVVVRLTELNVWIPCKVIAVTPDPMPLRFNLPDAARPCDIGPYKDDRVLGLSFRTLDLSPIVMSATNAELAAIVWDVENLGLHCEVGLVQRRAGAEPISLLRFATSRRELLLNAMQQDFAGLGDPENLDFLVHGEGSNAQWMAFDRRYGFIFHTWAHPDEISVEQITRRESRRLPWLAKKLLADLSAGEKLFVYQSYNMTSPEDALPLAQAIRQRGPGTLFAVIQNPARSGDVERFSDELLVGYISELTPDARDLDPVWSEWKLLLTAAHKAWKAEPPQQEQAAVATQEPEPPPAESNPTPAEQPESDSTFPAPATWGRAASRFISRVKAAALSRLR